MLGIPVELLLNADRAASLTPVILTVSGRPFVQWYQKTGPGRGGSSDGQLILDLLEGLRTDAFYLHEVIELPERTYLRSILYNSFGD